MKRKIISSLAISAILSLFSIAHAQSIGINTSTPKSTMDVNGKKDASGNLLATDITGLQAPRLTRAELTAKGNTLYGTNQKGTLIYITDITGGDVASQRVNITATGYYYFDGTVWVGVGNNGATAVTFPQTVLVASGQQSAQVNSIVALPLNTVQLNVASKVTVSNGTITIGTAGTYKIDAFIVSSLGTYAETWIDAFIYKNGAILLGYGHQVNDDGWGSAWPISYLGTFAVGDKISFGAQSSATSGGGQTAAYKVISSQIQQIN